MLRIFAQRIQHICYGNSLEWNLHSISSFSWTAAAVYDLPEGGTFMFHTSFLNKLIIAGLCLAVISVVAPNANAQRFDRGTKITVNQPFEVPGRALPAGTYVIRLMDVAGTRTVFQILNADETKSYAIVLAIPDWRLDTTEKTALSFFEAQPGAPVPIRSWFYPGYNSGVEFVYPKNKAAEIAKSSGEPVLAMEIPELAEEAFPAEFEKEPLVTVEPSGEEVAIAEIPSEEWVAPEEPLLTAEAALPPAVSAELPRTATPVPLVALTGLLAAGAAGALRVVRRKK
jgi:hypothetical protein